MIQTRFEGANRAQRKANTNLIFQSYVYVLYPMSAVAFCASIYMTLAVTVERRVNNFLTFPYKTCCKTHQKRGEQPVSDIFNEKLIRREELGSSGKQSQ